METFFYRESDADNADSWHDNKPYKQWFVMKDYLYDPTSSDMKLFIDDRNYIKNVILHTKDYFSDFGIVRKIYVYIS